MNQEHNRGCSGEKDCHCAHLQVDLCDYSAICSELAEAKAELEQLQVRYENRSLGFDAVTRELAEAKAPERPPLCGSSRPSQPSQVCDDKAGHIGGHSSQKHETWWPSDGSAPTSRYPAGLCPEHAVAMEVRPGSRTLTVEEIVAVRALIQERAVWPVGTGDVGVPKVDDTVRASLACWVAVKGGGK